MLPYTRARSLSSVAMHSDVSGYRLIPPMTSQYDTTKGELWSGGLVPCREPQRSLACLSLVTGVA